MVGDRSSDDGHVLRRVHILPPKGISSGERRCIAAGQRRLHSKDLVAAYRIFFFGLAWLGLAWLGSAASIILGLHAVSRSELATVNACC